jgi:hypothetical protein
MWDLGASRTWTFSCRTLQLSITQVRWVMGRGFMWSASAGDVCPPSCSSPQSLYFPPPPACGGGGGVSLNAEIAVAGTISMTGLTLSNNIVTGGDMPVKPLDTAPTFFVENFLTFCVLMDNTDEHLCQLVARNLLMCKQAVGVACSSMFMDGLRYHRQPCPSLFLMFEQP